MGSPKGFVRGIASARPVLRSLVRDFLENEVLKNTSCVARKSLSPAGKALKATPGVARGPA